MLCACCHIVLSPFLLAESAPSGSKLNNGESPACLEGCIHYIHCSLLEIYLFIDVEKFTAVLMYSCYSTHSTSHILSGENPLPLPLWCRCPSVHRCIIHAVLERDNSDRDWVVRVARSLAPLPHKIRLRDHT